MRDIVKYSFYGAQKQTVETETAIDALESKSKK